MKTVKTLLITLVFLLVLISLIYSASAITAKIGNARMVLRGKVGETLEKSIKVINDNNESVKIELVASGDLKNSINVLDNNFTLAPNTVKDAKINIKVLKEGIQNGTVVVKFTPLDIESKKNGVALGSVIILIGEKGNGTSVTIPDPGTNPSVNPGVIPGNFKFSSLTLGLIITAIVFLILIILLVVYSNKKNQMIINKEVGVKRVDEIKPKKRVKDQ